MNLILQKLILVTSMDKGLHKHKTGWPFKTQCHFLYAHDVLSCTMANEDIQWNKAILWSRYSTCMRGHLVCLSNNVYNDRQN